MVKRSHIKKYDIVRYGSHEWVVKRKKTLKCQLVRREVLLGVPIWVPIAKIKRVTNWRHHLQKGDPVKVFLGGTWCYAKIIKQQYPKLYIQPSFTNYTVCLDYDSGKIAEAVHDYPVWKEEETKYALHNGFIKIQRAPGIFYPMEYLPSVPFTKPKHRFIKTLKFAFQTMPSFPMKYYKRISKSEVMYDIYHSMSPDMPALLRHTVTQYVHYRRKFYDIKPALLQSHIESALLNNDHRRVHELTSASENEDVLICNECAIMNELSFSFFDVNIRVTDCLEIDLLWDTLYKGITPLPVRNILLNISKPLTYNPVKYAIDSTPCIQFILSRMLGMEEEPLQALHLREVNGFHLTEDRGFCEKTFSTFGGVINVYGLDTVALVRNLMQRKPLKTLIIVNSDTLRTWSGFSTWYGKKKEDDQVVVTTNNTLTRNWTDMKGFKRIICTALPRPNTVYSNVLKNHPAKVRWCVCKNKDEHLGWNMLQSKPDDRARISLSKSQMEQMGILFPVMTIQKTICMCSPTSYRQILRNIFFLSTKKIDEYLSKFLLHPSLVPVHIRGLKLDICEGTLDVIAERFGVKEETLKLRVTETCAICLETISDPSVTSCGHVFCEPCVKELDTRKINCAMCRAKFSGYMKISDTNTPGTIEMHNGSCFRIPQNETWGQKYHMLKKNSDATFITKYSSVRSLLRKHFPKTTIITEKSLSNGMTVHTKKIVLVEPGINIQYLDKAWSQDLEIIQLSYTVKH